MSLLRLITAMYWDEMIVCGRCRKYRFIDWGYRLCGTCYHKIKDKTGKIPGVRWRTKAWKKEKTG